MEKLLLLRHGNALSRIGNMSDFDRPLDITGKKQISIIADKLAENNQFPNLIISSTAKRAFLSASIIQNKKPIIQKTETDILYSASIYEYIDILTSQKNNWKTIMIVGHNPAISGFITRLTGKHIGMGTGNLCIIEIDIEKWSDLSFKTSVINTTLIKP